MTADRHASEYEETRRERLQAARTAAEAVQVAASYVWVRLEQHEAEAIAEAAQNFADSVSSVRFGVVREAWRREDLRKRIRGDMRLQLLDDVIRAGRVPVALPAEKLTYRIMAFGSPDKGAEVPEFADWDTVVVGLSVRTRTPPVG